MEYIDLHVHSTASDGSFTPLEVVALAKQRGLKAFALTDHDTIDGLAAAIAAGHELGIEVIPGIEISAQFTGGSMHILGYFIDHHHSFFQERLQVLKQARIARNPRIVEKLNKLGMPVSLEEIQAIARGGQVGRPHIARALLNHGYIRTVQEAFDRFLRNDGPAYEPKFRFPPKEAIALILEAHGIPVLAHPFTLGIATYSLLREQIQHLKLLGLAGLEVHYPEHAPAQQAEYLKIAREFGLLITGGSDFHGANKPEVELGRGAHQRHLTYNLVDDLKDWLQKQ
jgi:hypothetical protein